MSKQTLTVNTTVGAFTRVTGTAYTHAVVWASPRAAAAHAAVDGYKSGVHGRWTKDRGYGVTWHGSEGAARRAAGGKYLWDHAATLVGVFAVRV